MSYINYPGTAQLGQPDPVLEPERYQAWLQVTQHIQSGDRSTASYREYAQGGGIKNTTEYNAGRSGNVPPTPTYGLPPPPSHAPLVRPDQAHETLGAIIAAERPVMILHGRPKAVPPWF